MGTRRLGVALCGLILVSTFGVATSAYCQETAASVASRMRMHVENAGMHWTDEPIVNADQCITRAAGTLGQVQSLLVDLAGSEYAVAVTRVEMTRAPDSLLHHGTPLLVTITAHLVAHDDEATRRERWTMPALFTLVLRSAVQSQQTVVMEGKVGDGTFHIEGRTHGANGAAPIVKGLDAGPSKLVTAAEIKQSRTVEGVPDQRTRTQNKENLVVSFIVSGTYSAQNLSVDALKAMSYQ